MSPAPRKRPLGDLSLAPAPFRRLYGPFDALHPQGMTALQAHPKRHFQEDDNPSSPETFERASSAVKRPRHQNSPSGRCGYFTAPAGAFGLPTTTLAALLGLFPGMDEKVSGAVPSTE